MAVKEAAKAAKESVEDKVIDLTLDDSDSDPDSIAAVRAPVRPHAAPSKRAVSQSKASATSPVTGRKSPLLVQKVAPTTVKSSNLASVKPSSLKLQPDWSCPTCTLLNGSLALQCDACLTERPSEGIEGWTCLTCGEMGMPHDRWSCQFCGTVKTSS